MRSESSDGVNIEHFWDDIEQSCLEYARFGSGKAIDTNSIGTKFHVIAYHSVVLAPWMSNQSRTTSTFTDYRKSLSLPLNVGEIQQCKSLFQQGTLTADSACADDFRV